VKKKFLAATVVAGGVMIGSTGLASASHDHFILRTDQSGETHCRYIAHGQTAKGPGDGGFHALHDNVHTGQPGGDENGTDIDKADDGNVAGDDTINLQNRCDNVYMTGSHPDHR
jgi:hypothetical protein